MQRKKFKVRIRAFGFISDIDIEAEDSCESVEKAVLDKIGEKSIVWEANDFYDVRKCYITYEEVNNGSGQHGVVRTEDQTRV
jgi:hypothetical protein